MQRQYNCILEIQVRAFDSLHPDEKRLLLIHRVSGKLHRIKLLRISVMVAHFSLTEIAGVQIPNPNLKRSLIKTALMGRVDAGGNPVAFTW